MRYCQFFCLICCLLVCTRGSWSQLEASEFHVSPVGKATFDGSESNPWDLQTALNGGSSRSIQPGDTVWLHGGTYRGGYTSRISGTPELPISFRSAAGEHPRIDCRPRPNESDYGVFLIGTDDLIFEGLEFTCSDPKRETLERGSWPKDIARGHVDCRGSRLKFINLIVHDLGSGFGFWSMGEGGEVSGCIIYHNGWKAPDRGHGHGVYAQNRSGTKRIFDNIVFNQFGYGIHCYGSAKAALEGFDIEGNISFNNGCLTSPLERAPAIMIGGECPVKRIRLHQNCTFGGGIQLGYPWGVKNEDAEITENIIADQLFVRDFPSIKAQKNTFFGTSHLVRLETTSLIATEKYQWNNNNYFASNPRMLPFSSRKLDKTEGYSFEEWQEKNGIDSSSSFEDRAPAGVQVIVRPNRYEKGRAHVVIYNWDFHDFVDVNLREVPGLSRGFRLLNAQDYWGKPVLSAPAGTHSIRVSMKPGNLTKPVGMEHFELPVTQPLFGVYVVVPESY